MKIIKYTDVNATQFESDTVKGVTGRVVIGKKDGADNFCMRIFEISPGGNTPKHSHEWEHEIFVHAGEGEVYSDDRWNPVGPGNVVFVPAKDAHQIRNSGKEPFVFVCLVPSHAPEL